MRPSVVEAEDAAVGRDEVAGIAVSASALVSTPVSARNTPFGVAHFREVRAALAALDVGLAIHQRRRASNTSATRFMSLPRASVIG